MEQIVRTRDQADHHRSALALPAVRSGGDERSRVMLASIDAHAIFTTSSDGVVTHWTRGAELVFGYTAAEMVGKSYEAVVTPPDLPLRPGGDQRVPGERWRMHKDGSQFYAAERVTRLLPDETGVSGGFVHVVHDETQRLRTTEAIRQAAARDRLTGLANRASFFERLQSAITSAKQRPFESFAVLFIDVDNFKGFNDTYGHSLADSILVEFGRRLEQIVRPEDLVARLGGDEFAILLQRVESPARALAVAERMSHVFAEPFVVDDVGLRVTAAAGIAVCAASSRYERPEAVLRDADSAMYEAKARGLNQYALFDARMLDRSQARRTLEKDVRHAARRNELRVRYEPIVALARPGERHRRFKASLLWERPGHGTLEAEAFMRIAEDTGCVAGIERWAIESVASTLAERQRAAGDGSAVTTSVELSAKGLALANLSQYLCDVAGEHRLVPGSLHIEIDEAALAGDPGLVASGLEELRRCNAEIYVRRFATGRSTLANLRRFPIRALKIDRSFVRAMLAQPASDDMVRTITLIARGLGLQTIAEGVATRDEAARLRELGCDFAQGPYFPQCS